eukprot:4293678-Pyramimonas_sp.AAC.2
MSLAMWTWASSRSPSSVLFIVNDIGGVAARMLMSSPRGGPFRPGRLPWVAVCWLLGGHHTWAGGPVATCGSINS